MRSVTKEVIGIIICASLLGVCFYLIIKLFEKEENKYKKHIGKTVIIGKDTSTIVDYSTFFHTLKLSNGSEVSVEYFKNKE